MILKHNLDPTLESFEKGLDVLGGNIFMKKLELYYQISKFSMDEYLRSTDLLRIL